MNRHKRLATLIATKKRKSSLQIDLDSGEIKIDQPTNDNNMSCKDIQHLNFTNFASCENANARRRSSKTVKIVQLAVTKEPSLKNTSNNIFKRVYKRKKSKILNPFFANKKDDVGIGKSDGIKRFRFQNMKSIRKEFFIDLVASSIKSISLKKSHFLNNDAVKRVLIDEIIKPIDGAIKKPVAKNKHRKAIINSDTFLSSIRNLISSYTVEIEPQHIDNSKRDINVHPLIILSRKSFFALNNTTAFRSS